MITKGKLYVSIKLAHFEFLPQEITHKLSLTPTLSFLKGEEFLFGQLRIPMISKYNYWEYGIEFTIGIANVSRIIKQFIVEIIKSRHDILTELSSSCKMEFYIAQNLFDDYHPSLTFEKDDILLLGKIGMKLDLDLWNLKDGESS